MGRTEKSIIIKAPPEKVWERLAAVWQWDEDTQKNVKSMEYTFKVGTTWGPASVTYILEPVEAGTKITNVWEYELPWGILGKFLDKLFAQRTTQKNMEKSLENLKSILEK